MITDETAIAALARVLPAVVLSGSSWPDWAFEEDETAERILAALRASPEDARVVAAALLTEEQVAVALDDAYKTPEFRDDAETFWRPFAVAFLAALREL